MRDYPNTSSVWREIRRRAVMGKLAHGEHGACASTNELWHAFGGERHTYDVLQSRLTELYTIGYVFFSDTTNHEFYSGIQVGTNWALTELGAERIQQGGSDTNIHTLLQADLRRHDERYME